jgi:hypothetical protein
MLCLCCGKALGPAWRGSESPSPPPPSEATVFYAHGNFGSTVWDPQNDSRHLTIFVCDGCLVEHAGRVWAVTPGPLIQHNDYAVWDPQNE